MWEPTPVLGIDLVFDVGAAVLRVVKAPRGKSRDVGCARSLLCVWMHSCARADANPAKTQELCHLLWVPAFQLREEKRKMLPCGCCLLSIREKPGSLQASREVITTINRLHSQPCSRDCCKVVGGTGISALLPPGVSLQLAGNCPRAGTAPVKSEEDVNLLTIFAVCVSSQMKLINKGRNVTLSKVLTSKSKYLHRCAGSCQLLGIAMFLDQFMPPTASALFLHCSAPAAPWEASSPGGGQGLQHRGRREALSHDAEEGGCWAPGLFAQEGAYFSPVVSEPHFFLPQG